MAPRLTFAFRLVAALMLCAGVSPIASGSAAPFDLEGPGLNVQVTRAGVKLPIGQVPNLIAGDSVAIKADFPESQSARYLLIVAFLRGATNPPPANWFFQCETWTAKCRKDGLTVAVPKDAQQALVFLAPSSGNGFRTLTGAVQGRPGAFVRAAQQLNQASLDRARLEIYLSDLRALDSAEQARVKEATPLLARSLAIKVNEKCLDRISQLQVACLMDGQDTLILSDGHSASMIEALTASPATDVLMTAAGTPQLNSGYYSPYIASVIDLARLLDPFKRANYQYVPALAFQRDERMSLRLNTPPSFQDPKSVLVAALPAIETPRLPLLRAVDPRDIYCARKTSLVLPVEGAPLVFGTQYAHDLNLRLTLENGSQIELPARPDALQGGFVVDTAALASMPLGPSVRGVLHGKWGFEDYVGPEFQMVSPVQQAWNTGIADDDTLIVGREGVIHVRAAHVSCLKDVEVEGPGGKMLSAQWTAVTPNEVMVKFPLQQVEPGALTLRMTQHGSGEPQQIGLKTYAAAAHLDDFIVHAGDLQGRLKGQRLDQVTALNVNGVEFAPGSFSTGKGNDELVMLARGVAPTSSAVFNAGEALSVKVALTDGRVLGLKSTVLPPRPGATLIDKSVQMPRAPESSNIKLADESELPQGGSLTFSLRSKWPVAFAADERLEIASLDGTFATSLSLAKSQLKLAGPGVWVATLDPAKAFGPAAFGPLQFRVAIGEVSGDWAPLITLIRLPELTELRCPSTAGATCSLSGSDLYLIEAVARGPGFEDAVPVPEGFPGRTLPVPHPGDDGLYVKLRDNPAVVHAVALTARMPEGPAPAAAPIADAGTP
jgi:hypothetical protein